MLLQCLLLLLPPAAPGWGQVSDTVRSASSSSSVRAGNQGMHVLHEHAAAPIHLHMLLYRLLLLLLLLMLRVSKLLLLMLQRVDRLLLLGLHMLLPLLLCSCSCG
jgi:hypothetical protein